MINNSKENDFLVLNPDTLWNEKYVNEINKMQSFYFLNKKNCILLLVNKILSFDKNLEGDFSLKDNLLKKDNKKNFIYIGCQILNRSIFDKYNIDKFSITRVWDDLLNTNELYGFESSNKFYHLTNFEIFKKLQDL